MTWTNKATFPQDIQTVSEDLLVLGIKTYQPDAERGRDELRRRGWSEDRLAEATAPRMNCNYLVENEDGEVDAYCGLKRNHDGEHGEWQYWE